MADTMSIEETNRIRASLGMKPLPVPGAGPVFKDDDTSGSESEEPSTLESREAQGTANWQRHQDEAERKRQREARNEAIRKARDNAKRFAKLEGQGLGEADEDELDTKTWLVQQKKRQKKLEKERLRAKKLGEELRAREEQAYTSKDLAGVKVGHHAGDFDESTGEQILTLKDATIEENEEEGDELENIDLRESERRAERLDLLKKKPAYDSNADEEDGEERSVLKHYDEAIDGKKRKRFTLGAKGMANGSDGSKRPLENDPSRQTISLDILKEIVTSDYQEPKEVSFKKHKKNKKKSTRQKALDDESLDATTSLSRIADEDTMEIDSRPSSRVLASFIDDDDLQASLAKARKGALKKRKKLSAKELAEQIQDAPGEEHELSATELDAGLVMNETSEFVAALRPEETQPRLKREARSPEANQEINSGEDVKMTDSYAAIIDPEESEGIKLEAQPLTETGLAADTQLTQGMGSTLRLLQDRGLVERSDADSITANHRNRQQFINERRRIEDEAEVRARRQRERDRASGRLDRLSAREREEYARQENRHRDQFQARQMAEAFDRQYKPNVELRYTDDHGRDITQKEAFKALSHQFHGKGSGKQKTEKRLKRIEDEKRKAAEPVLGNKS